ncbi:MAG: fumarylacetoacetate hydrolase family protein [Dehalococcoidia bacterium]|nr:fumarylacetoacetate hydrolase family protein [Dehalococcoidia bacterium]
MRWCRFSVGNKVSYGIVEGNEVVQVAGSPFGRYRRTGARLPLSSVKLLIPCVPPTFYAAGVNYMDHVRGMAAISGRSASPPPKADIGYRANNALIAHGEPIVLPRDATERTEYEGELVVVIGKQAKHLSEKEALSCVLGYSIGNDFSERTWQFGDRTLWRGKNTDTFKPMGPWIETDVDLDKMRTIVRVNRRVMIDFATNNMIFGIAHYLSVMTKYVTLYPGDVVWMGTDGVPKPVKHGDVVEVEITGIGVLRNPVVREGA